MGMFGLSLPVMPIRPNKDTLLSAHSEQASHQLNGLA